MNDKKFIEELKFKREEYRVSQKRLAVACGISREHYNRIETGKLPLTEELKAEIQKQLERLNPLEPMFILVDYFRVRFPTTDPLTVIKDILHIKPRHMLHEEYGRYGYEEQYILGDITVLVSSNPSLGVLLELKGKGCRQIEGYLLAQQRSWFDLMMDCLTSDGVIKRLDLAINDRVGVLGIPKLIEKYQRGECISYFLLKRFCIRVQPKQIGWRELVPMALSMVPVLTVGYLIEALESGHGTGVPDTLGLFLYELCSLTSVLVMIGVDNVAFMREEAQSARMLEAVMRMQANQYDQRRRAMDEIQRKHHDLKHHLLYIARLESEGERIAYANEALETSFGEEQFLQTGNEVLDTVLSLSAQRCRDLDIRLVLFVDAQCMDFMRPGDIVAIASNALDNAVEAQMRLPEQVAREIMVRIHGDEHWLYLHFENTFAGEIKWRDGLPATNKENAQGHGLGLKSIRAAIERYEGALQIEARDGRFALNILIPREMAGSSN